MQTTTVDVLPASDAHASIPTMPWIHRIAQVLAGFTFLLISFGGHVTTIKAGDSEPTWSWRFWEWFTVWRQLEGGHYFEITHRQIGTLVGFLAIALVVALWMGERRAWVRRLGYLAFVLILVQGLLGGLRVLVVSDPGVQEATMHAVGLQQATSARVLSGIIHASLGLTLFSMVVGLVVVTSPYWFHTPSPVDPMRLRIYRRMGIMTIVALLLQILLGAFLRHAGWSAHALLAHGTGGLMVALFAILLAVLGLSFPTSDPRIRRPAMAICTIVLCQVILGLIAWGYPMALPLRTLHHVTGGILLALCIMITLRSFRLLIPISPKDTLPVGGA